MCVAKFVVCWALGASSLSVFWASCRSAHTFLFLCFYGLSSYHVLYVMFFLNSYMLWSFVFFFLFVYITLFYSFVIYLLPVTLSNANLSLVSNRRSAFYFISGLECLYLKLLPLVLMLAINVLWVSSSVTAWFGNLVFTSFQSKMVFFTIFIFWVILIVFANVSFFSSNEVYDFFIVKYHFFFGLPFCSFLILCFLYFL